MEDQLRKSIAKAAGGETEVELSYPEESFGDYSTNIAMKLAAKDGRNPRAIAEEIALKLRQSVPTIRQAEVAGPGFINLRLSDEALLEQMSEQPARPLEAKTIVSEFSDPNPFKLLHAGHLYTSIVGDAIANLLELGGAKVYRVNYGGDVGLHVGKTMWAVLSNLGGENPTQLNNVPADKRGEWLSDAYVRGTKAYDEDEQAKQQIIELNKRIYDLQASNDHASSLAQIYWTTRQWSYDALDRFYSRIQVHFDKYYPESQTAPLGMEIVRRELGKGVFEESDGAVVFRAEKYGLHTRVFINSQGLPTYETKEVGLIMLKERDYHFDKSIIITGNEQEQYMAVVYKAIEQFAPGLADKSDHITHGMVRLAGNVKMSSRVGNIIKANDILDAAAEASKAVSGKEDERVVLAAVKYSFLKQRIGGDIIFDPEESVSILGNSGVYLQYAHARARSILEKAGNSPSDGPVELTADERPLVLKLSRYSRVVAQAAAELSPHQVCTYLYDLAQEFNRFYEHNRVVGDEREAVRLRLVESYAKKLKDGLALLGIEAPEHL